jgi:transposase
VQFLDRLPLNRSNKVDKQALRARWSAEHPDRGEPSGGPATEPAGAGRSG